MTNTVELGNTRGDRQADLDRTVYVTHRHWRKDKFPPIYDVIFIFADLSVGRGWSTTRYAVRALVVVTVALVVDVERVWRHA